MRGALYGGETSSCPWALIAAGALAQVLRTAGDPQGEYAVVTASAQRAGAAARLRSEGYLEIRQETSGGKQLAVRLTPIGLALRNKLQRSILLGGSESANR
jgi:hypothetical protein